MEKIINSNKRAFGLPFGADPSEIDPKDMLFDKGMPIGNLTSQMTLKEVNATMQSYFGLISHCTNKGLREKVISDFVLHCTDASRERALQEEQRKEQDTWKLQTR